jgi:hypothetical protein
MELRPIRQWADVSVRPAAVWRPYDSCRCHCLTCRAALEYAITPMGDEPIGETEALDRPGSGPFSPPPHLWLSPEALKSVTTLPAVILVKLVCANTFAMSPRTIATVSLVFVFILVLFFSVVFVPV